MSKLEKSEKYINQDKHDEDQDKGKEIDITIIIIMKFGHVNKINVYLRTNFWSKTRTSHPIIYGCGHRNDDSY